MKNDGSKSNTDFADKTDIVIGVSSCLLGENVRYDGGNRLQGYIADTLGNIFTLKSFCPEMAIGLGVPRETIKLVQQGDEIRCVGTHTRTLDVTDKLIDLAYQHRPLHENLCGYIFKKGSPSCGVKNVKLYGLDTQNPDIPQLEGVGLYARVLQENFPQMPVEEEDRLADPILRADFIKRVVAYSRWKVEQSRNI